MHKHKMAKLVESICERIVERSKGTLDQSGARALLGMLLTQQTDKLVAAALPQAEEAVLVR
jgi:hypothetical protein